MNTVIEFNIGDILTFEQHKAIQLAKRQAKNEFINSIPEGVIKSLESYTFAQFADWYTPNERIISNFVKEVCYQYCMDSDICAEDVTETAVLEGYFFDEAFNDMFRD